MAEEKSCWLYLRSWSQEAIEAQKAELLAFASEQGYKVKNIIFDIGSWKESARHGLDRVLQGAAGKDFHILLVQSWSRLGRDLQTMSQNISALREYGIEVCSLKERGLDCDEALMITQFAAAIQDLEGEYEEDAEIDEAFEMTQHL